jgi:hypothetical protein
VVDGASTPLPITADLLNFTAPGVELTTTVTASGFILHESTTSSMRYTYDLPALANTFPNLDRDDPDGKAAVDTVTLSFFARAGDGTYHARQLTLQGEELQMPEQRAVVVPARRRAAR